MKTIATAAVASIVLAGCAATTTGITSIGPDTYMLGGLGSATDQSGSIVKARFFREAGEFCTKQGKVMHAVNSTAQDPTPSSLASAEVQFRCK